MLFVNKRRLKDFYEKEAERLQHQEVMYLKGNKYEVWWHRKRLRFIISFLQEIFERTHITTFADIGCAEGIFVKYVASLKNGCFCVGADIARKYVEKAKVKNTKSNVDYIVCDVENLPFKTGSIDLILCSEVLEHVYNYQKALNELCRVGKKQLVISFPGHSYFYKIVNKIRGLQQFVTALMPRVGHVSEIEVREIKNITSGKCKFCAIKIGGALPLFVYKKLCCIQLIEAIDSLLCKVLERFRATNYATIHVIRMEKKRRKYS